MILNRSFVGLLLLAIGIAGLTGCTQEQQPLVVRGETMGTDYQVSIAACPSANCLGQLQEQIHHRLDEINSRLSTYDPHSELSRFNDYRETDWVRVSDDFYNVVAHALEVSRATGGAFDITIGRLIDAWGFGAAPFTGNIPASDVTSRIQNGIGFEKLEVRGGRPAVRKLSADISIDLSAIAKGYAVDEIGRIVEKQGIDSYLVEIGGEVRAKGTRPGGGPWRIAIEHPAIDAQHFDNIVELSNRSIATSGDYLNYYRRDGRRYSHTIDPDTAAPVDHGLASVSVIGPTAMHADAMATALLVMGPERGFALALEQNLPALFVVRNADAYEQRMTPAFQQFLLQ